MAKREEVKPDLGGAKLDSSTDPSGEKCAALSPAVELSPAAELELSRAAEAAENGDATEDAAIGEACEAGMSAPGMSAPRVEM